jgi:uncharacterized membrane protein
MSDFLSFLKVFVIFLIIDIPVITYINNKMYTTQFNRIQGPKSVNFYRIIIAALLAYILLAFGIYYFAIKQKSILNGFLIGLCIYGVYNMTNLATLREWGAYEATVDTLWGASLCAIITWIYLTYLKF